MALLFRQIDRPIHTRDNEMFDLALAKLLEPSDLTRDDEENILYAYDVSGDLRSSIPQLRALALVVSRLDPRNGLARLRQLVKLHCAKSFILARKKVPPALLLQLDRLSRDFLEEYSRSYLQEMTVPKISATTLIRASVQQVASRLIDISAYRATAAAFDLYSDNMVVEWSEELDELDRVASTPGMIDSIIHRALFSQT